MIHFCDANETHLEEIIRLLSDDVLGQKREAQQSIVTPSYQGAFRAIAVDPNAALIIGCEKKQAVACAQFNLIPCLTYQGGTRAQIEGVRVHRDYRGQGIGKRLFEYLIQRAEDKGAHMVQLTTDKQRQDAYAFYEALGFQNTHDGFKLFL